MDASTYRKRRQLLRTDVAAGEILIFGNGYASRNYADNLYPFRQDSSFLYYGGASSAGMAMMIDEDGRSTLYGRRRQADDLVWFGPIPGLGDYAEVGGFDDHGSIVDMEARIAKIREAGGPIHFLPPYRPSRRLRLAELFGVEPRAAHEAASRELVQAVIRHRSVKSDDEVAEIENALEVTAEMFAAAMAATHPDLTESEIAAELVKPATAANRQLAFLPIVTVRGEVLHNESYDNSLSAADMMVIDSGAESERWYASDITRSFPVNGHFEPAQRDIYEVVLAAQLAAITTASPAVTNREVHLVAARTIAAGLADVGLMKGDADAAVEAGAHALFFPHGIGHMLGLDVHDMEDLGDEVGYPEGESRSTQFGLNALRLARRLEPGFVITIEPGVYFIPALIDRWRAEGRHADFIRYDKVQAFRGFGGIRIEDDVLITESGSRVLGPGIPKSVSEVEQAVRNG
jgi:Xaa-Pro aminopeptidase